MSASGQDSPGVIAPPPLIYAVCLAFGIGLDYLIPGPVWPLGPRWGAGGVLAVVSLLLAFWAIAQFHKIGTSVDVHKPATALATAGPYRFTRNPIYLALSLQYLGIGVLTGGIWVLVLVIPALLVMRFGVIAREERYLERKFGPSYLGYKTSVRRWL